MATSHRLSFDGSSILITGGTGSFGQACVGTLLERYKLRRLVVFSRDEMKQASMAEVYPVERHQCLRYFIGDVRDASRLAQAMRGIDYVIHAAAMKIVPTAEYNPFECVRTNIHGAENVLQASLAAGVKRVIALSTDKAVAPINLYGATKLTAEKIFVAANSLGSPDSAKFSVARYGNVLGSRGSVVQVFQRMVRDGADSLPITDPRMTRFWITLRQGVDFVLTALAEMQGGEVFVPKLPSMRVADLASSLGPGLPQRTVGIRPGEKLHETLITRTEAGYGVDTGNHYIVYPSIAPWSSGLAPPPGSKPLDGDFEYSSDTNSDWLSVEALRRLVAESV